MISLKIKADLALDKCWIAFCGGHAALFRQRSLLSVNLSFKAKVLFSFKYKGQIFTYFLLRKLYLIFKWSIIYSFRNLLLAWKLSWNIHPKFYIKILFVYRTQVQVSILKYDHMFLCYFWSFTLITEDFHSVVEFGKFSS